MMERSLADVSETCGISKNQMMRIDHIFVHRYNRINCLFIQGHVYRCLQSATEIPFSVRVLAPTISYSEETILLDGLPAILP